MRRVRSREPSQRRPGLLEVADRGTLFLDEIGDLDLAVQPKLLKVLEEQTFRRLGDVRDRHVDIWLIAATHQDLAAIVEQKRFRSDLYFRISTLSLRLPPLRERVEDIPILAGDFLHRIASEVDRPALSLSSAALRRLQSHPWPGNIRELRNVLERAALLSSGSVLEAADLGFDFQGGDRRGRARRFDARASRAAVDRAGPRRGTRQRGAGRGPAWHLPKLALPEDPEVRDRRVQNLESRPETGKPARGARGRRSRSCFLISWLAWRGVPATVWPSDCSFSRA